MPDRPFHHGNLRDALLTAAEQTIREQGVDALSLRQLARQAGVSHAAPARHFPDRQALLDAMAERGFRTLGEAVRRADEAAGSSPRRRFRAVARAYVGFAIDQAALMDLMFATKNAGPSPDLHRAADDFFALVGGVMAETTTAHQLPLTDPGRLQLLLVATLQGIATLAAAGRIDRAQVDQLVDDTTAVFGSGRS